MLEGDKYHLWVPIQDTELNKAIEVDENGDYIVQGVMTSDDKDEEADVIDPTGMDCSYFLEKGWIKYEHGNNPEQFIGEPVEIRLGRFTHPKLNKPVHGIFVKGRLYAQRKLAQEAVKTIQDLQKSNTKRCMGWSIEGNVVERDRKTGKILKSVLRNVVLTMNPVNTMTWVELAKSFAKNHELTIDCEGFDKSLDTGSMAEIMPQSLEGMTHEEAIDPEKQEKFIKLLRKLVNDFRINKSFAAVFLNKSQEAVKEDATHYAYVHGFTYEEAYTFGSFISDKQGLLKSMFQIDGGEKMGLLDVLNEELEELRKSMNEEEEEDKKGKKAEEEDGEEREGAEDSEEEQESEEDEDEEEKEKAEKSFGRRSSLQKSLAKRHRQAFEVSDFLSDLTDEIGLHLEGLQKSITLSNRKQEALMKSMASMLEVMQELTVQVEDIKAENETLRKSLDEVLSQPIGRKSVVSQREYQTISKSKSAENEPLTIDRVRAVLEKSFEKGELNGYELVRFENGVPIQMLNLPQSVKQELGLV